MGPHLKTNAPPTTRPRRATTRTHISFPTSLRERAGPRMAAHGIDDFSEYVRHLIREDVRAGKGERA